MSPGSDPEPFWALRGGGGDFALVTAVEFDLYPAPTVYGGRMMWPNECTPEVFEAFLELTAQAPPELSIWVSRLRFPQAPPVVVLDAAYLGDAEEGRALLSRLDEIDGAITDRRGVVAVSDLGDITAGPGASGPSLSRVELLTGLDDLAAGILRAVSAEQKELVAELDEYVSGRKPYGFLAPGDSAATAFPERTLTRLRELKRARDPRDVFRADFPVLG
ncbi:hypothetical protein ACQPYK_01370 [Streptosporangium sp. CA-135522]|uniref:hypothetical protein n=1 Tax=Streptosporangium sp. CA-135522 TaxID=3240072 RepID=UPI003D8B9175